MAKQRRRVKRLDPKVMQKNVDNTGENITAKLNAVKFGLALGIIFAASMVFFSLWVMIVGTGQTWMNLTAEFYLGYSTTFTGMLLGAIYGFIDGFIFGFVLVWLYNKLL